MDDNQQAQGGFSQTPLSRVIRAVLIFLPVLIYLPTFGGDVAVPPGEAAYSDLLISHYPYLLYLRQSIIVNHQIPLWSSLIHSGAPLAANPLAGIFYLPGWAAMLFPLPAGLSICLAGHAIFGSWGMYRFLQQKNAGEMGSILGAVSFGLMPKIAAHFGAGHVTLIYAISWTPWLLFCSERDRQGWKTGLIAGMLFLADPRWSIYAGALWITYDIAYRKMEFWKRFLRYLKSGLIALLISAPLLIPLLEFLRYATRKNLASADVLTGSLPIANLIGIIIPGSGGNIEWYFYSGGALLALLISQLFIKEFRKRNTFWVSWVLISLFLSLGTFGLEAAWISRIPIIGWLRIPARSLFLSGISLSVIAGSAIDHISKNRGANRSLPRVYVAIIAMGVMMIAGVTTLYGVNPLMIVWGLAFFAASGGMMLAIHGNPSRQYLVWILMGFLVIDLLGAGLTAYRIQPKEFREPNEAQFTLFEEEGYFRVYSPSYSVAQSLAAEHFLELADGVDPMQIAGYVEFMAEATGVEPQGYSVTIPPFKTGNPSQDNINAPINADLLGLLNVKYIISDFEIEAQGLTPVVSGEQGYLYLNEKVLPRAWTEDPGEERADWSIGELGRAEILSKTPNRMLIKASGPGRLVVSEIQYPGWKAYVDGKRIEIGTSHDILRSVLLSEGEHQVDLKFQPLSVYLGLVLALTGWIVAACLLFKKGQGKQPG